MIAKNKSRITISIPKELEKYLRQRAKKFRVKISEIITNAVDQHFYEYEDDYPWEKIRNDKSKK